MFVEWMNKWNYFPCIFDCDVLVPFLCRHWMRTRHSYDLPKWLFLLIPREDSDPAQSPEQGLLKWVIRGETNAKWLIFFLINLFIYLFLLCWVFVSVRGLSLVAASGCHSSSRCAGLSLSWPLLLRSTGSRHAGSVVVAHGPSCSAACEIFPDQGSNPCPLHWQADSQPLRHQGNPWLILMFNKAKQKQTHRLREWTYGYQRGRVGGGIDWAFGVDMYTLLYLK